MSSLLNASDPVAMHLLMENAMIDSKPYEILSFEEVEEMKNERASFQHRIEATRRKLALELKLKDAAQSLNRLYSTKSKRESDQTTASGSPKSSEKTRKSLLGSRRGSSNILSRTDDEYEASNRKCEELRQELSEMEIRYQETERRLLQHTAGILQLTHKGLKKNARRGNLPTSPDSLPGINGRSMASFDGTIDFDDRSLYKSPDHFGEDGVYSPADAQMLGRAQKQLSALTDHIHRLVLQADPQSQLSPPQSAKCRPGQQGGHQVQIQLDHLQQALQTLEDAQAQSTGHRKSLDESQERLEDVNTRLHELLKKITTGNQSPVARQPDFSDGTLQTQVSVSEEVLDRLKTRIEHLVEQKKTLTRQIQQQRSLNSKSDGEKDAQIMKLTKELASLRESEAHLQEEAQNSTDQIHLLMEQLDSARQESVLLGQKREVDNDNLLQAEREEKEQAEESLRKLEEKVQAETSAKDRIEDSLKKAQKASKADNEARQRVEEHLRKVQEASQVNKEARQKAEEQAKKLQSTLQAERASKKKADDDLKHATESLQLEIKSRQETEESLAKLQSTLQAGDDAQRQINENVSQLQASVHAEKEGKLEAEKQADQLEELLQKERDGQRHTDDTLTHLQDTLQAERQTVKNLEEQLTQLQDDLDEAKIDKTQTETEVKKCREEIEELEGTVVRTQTDLTVVRAELDGAYGTRAQRAADVTSNPAVQKEIDALHDRNSSLQKELEDLREKGSKNPELEEKVRTLEKELKDTIEEYAAMTKASVGFEKDREEFEASIDHLRERCESLETQLSEEKIRGLGGKSPALNGQASPGASTSTMVLKNEFKKMMRDTRAENLKALKVCISFHFFASRIIG